MKKINLEVTCKRNRFGYWNSCKRLPNFVNVAALVSYLPISSKQEINFTGLEEGWQVSEVHTPGWGS